jgi:hypothetical protein
MVVGASWEVVVRGERGVVGPPIPPSAPANSSKSTEAGAKEVRDFRFSLVLEDEQSFWVV